MQSWGVCVNESQVTSGKLFLCVFYSFSGERLCIFHPMLKGVGDSVAGHAKDVRFLTHPDCHLSGHQRILFDPVLL